MEHQNKAHLVIGMLLFSVFGLIVETVFTGISASWSGSFKGGVSLLMIPVYSLSYLLGLFAIPRLENKAIFNWYFRLPLLVITIYVIEWGFGAFYKMIGLVPWHYEHGWASDFSDGNITLYFLPAWFGFAIIVIPVVRIVRDITPTFINLVKKEV